MENIIKQIEESFNKGLYKDVIDLCDSLINNKTSLFEAYGYRGLAMGWSTTIDNVKLDEATKYLIESLKYVSNNDLNVVADKYLNELVNITKQILNTCGNVYNDNPSSNISNAYIADIKNTIAALELYLDTLGQNDLKIRIKNDMTMIVYNQITKAFSNKISKEYDPNNYPTIKDYDLFIDRLDGLFNLLDTCNVISNNIDIKKGVLESMVVVCEELLLSKAYDNKKIIERFSLENYSIVLDKYKLILNTFSELSKEYNLSNNKYFEVHTNILRFFSDSLRLRLKVEETKRLIKNENNISLVNEAISRINDVETILNEYDKTINDLRYSLY